jgi:hypothetical protein
MKTADPGTAACTAPVSTTVPTSVRHQEGRARVNHVYGGPMHTPPPPSAV